MLGIFLLFVMAFLTLLFFLLTVFFNFVLSIFENITIAAMETIVIVLLGGLLELSLGIIITLGAEILSGEDALIIIMMIMSFLIVLFIGMFILSLSSVVLSILGQALVVVVSLLSIACEKIKNVSESYYIYFFGKMVEQLDKC